MSEKTTTKWTTTKLTDTALKDLREMSAHLTITTGRRISQSDAIGIVASLVRSGYITGIENE